MVEVSDAREHGRPPAVAVAEDASSNRLRGARLSSSPCCVAFLEEPPLLLQPLPYYATGVGGIGGSGGSRHSLRLGLADVQDQLDGLTRLSSRTCYVPGE